MVLTQLFFSGFVLGFIGYLFINTINLAALEIGGQKIQKIHPYLLFWQ